MNEAYRSCKRLACGHARKRHGPAVTATMGVDPANGGPCSMCGCAGFHGGFQDRGRPRSTEKETK